MRRDHMLTGSCRFKKTLSSTLSIFGNGHPWRRNQTSRRPVKWAF
jgi:hypothetical protein